MVAISCFMIIVLLSLYITWWAASRIKASSDFYTAGGNITAFQNGLALAGDALSVT